MDKLPVGQLPDLAQSNNDDEIMVITNSEYNQLKKEKISDLITDFTSTNENNALTKGTDGKMFVTDFGNASNITEGTLPTSVLPEIPLEKIPDIPKDKLPPIETADLPVSGVTADTYAYPSSVTVNAQGQVTAIEEGTPSGSNADTDLSNITEAGKDVIRQTAGTGLAIGSLVAVDHVLSFAESKGLAPLGSYVYKEAVSGSRYGYPTFYNDCVEEFEDATAVQENFVQPVLSANGTLGGDSFAVSASSENVAGYGAYGAFDGSDATDRNCWHSNVETNSWITFYNPTPIIVKNLLIYNRNTTQQYTYAITGGIVQGSNDNSDWTTITSFTNDVTTPNSTWNIDLSTNTTAYKYYKIQANNTNTNVCIGEISITAYINTVYKRNPNGHVFYDIADKAKADSIYEATGACWAYGVDTTNERIFLPRNDWFFQSGNADNVGKFNEAGLPNITGTAKAMGYAGRNDSGALYTTGAGNEAFAGGADGRAAEIINLDASRSNTIYGKSNTVQPPSVNQIVYMVVGNTEVESAITDVTDVTTTKNDTIPLFTGMYYDFTPNHVSWLKAGEQANNGGLYASAYNTLVNELTTPRYGLKVIDTTAMQSNVDYSEYWKIDQDAMTFTTPTRTAERVLVAKKEATAQDPTWFNWYSDGWLEQGGTLTTTIANNQGIDVSLVKPYKNTTYKGFVNALLSNDGSTSATTLAIKPSSVTIARISNDGDIAAMTGLNWQTSGYGAIPSLSDYTEDIKLYFKVSNAVQNLQVINVGEITESLANKLDADHSNDTKPYITETYVNGTSWYRVWSDGWCEQGGQGDTDVTKTVQLIKKFTNTNYLALAGDVVGKLAVGTVSKSESTFIINATARVIFNWFAAGYSQ